MPDVRTGHRFPLQLPITISEGQSPRKHRGTTANVSAAGVYVQAERPLKVGSRITFEIMLPGTIVGLLTGYATQRYGRKPEAAVT